MDEELGNDSLEIVFDTNDDFYDSLKEQLEEAIEESFEIEEGMELFLKRAQWSAEVTQDVTESDALISFVDKYNQSNIIQMRFSDVRTLEEAIKRGKRMLKNITFVE